MNGVLKSWAVPKGPSLDPQDKRLAVHVEDHPMEYGSFEGRIPEGEYGAGEVIVWDHGKWLPQGSLDKDYKRGRLKFELAGEKLRGIWSLSRMAPRDNQKREHWLLIKSKDEEARSRYDFDITEERTESVMTGARLARDRNSKAKAGTSNAKKTTVRKSAKPIAAKSRPKNLKLPKEAFPSFISPQLATSVAEPPSGSEWLHEMKFDGYRILAHLNKNKVTLHTRRGNDWSSRFKALSKGLEAVPAKQAIIDGEACIVPSDGRTSFQGLQNYFKSGKGNLVFFAFDMLHLNGANLRKLPLEHRKSLLQELVAEVDNVSIRFSEHVIGDGDAFFASAVENKIEGIVSKRRDAIYQSVRTRTWLKVKTENRQEFVIGGLKKLDGKPEVAALLLGYYANGNFTYAGKVGTGFNNKSRIALFQTLTKHSASKSPFKKNPYERGVVWVKPKYVAEIAFHEWTADSQLRAPVFQGLREDKDPTAVGREAAVLRARGRKVSSKAASVAKTEEVKLTHPERVLYPEQGLTKAELADYYAKVAKWVLPDLIDRPLSLVRCPRGRDAECFFQKHSNDAVPENITRISIPDEKQEYMVVRNVNDLRAIVQISTLELHTWNCHLGNLDKPDRMIFDLDPGPGVKGKKVVECALLLREALEHLGLSTFVRLSGGKGLHVVVPLKPKLGWDEVKLFSKTVASLIVAADPKSYIATAAKSKRNGKIFIDYLRNGYGATSIANYSPRAREGAPVATPISWKELKPETKFNAFNVRNIQKRLKNLKSDPWAGYDDSAVSITGKILAAVGLK